MKLGLISDVDDNLGKGLRLLHGPCLEGSQAVSTGIGLQEQVVLLHVVDKAFLGQCAVGNALDKGMLSVILPVLLTCLEKVVGQWLRVVLCGPRNKKKKESSCQRKARGSIIGWQHK